MAVAGKGFGKGLIVLGFDKLVNETAGEGVHNPEALLSRRCAQSDEPVGFTGPGIPDEAQGLAFADPVPGREGVDDCLTDVRVRVEIKVPKPFIPWEARRLDPPDRRTPVPIITLGQEPLIGELFPAGDRQDFLENCPDGGQPQAPARLVHHSNGGKAR